MPQAPSTDTGTPTKRLDGWLAYHTPRRQANLESDASYESSQSSQASLSLSPPSPPPLAPSPLLLYSSPKGITSPILPANNTGKASSLSDSAASHIMRAKSKGTDFLMPDKEYVGLICNNSPNKLQSRAEKLLERWCPKLLNTPVDHIISSRGPDGSEQGRSNTTTSNLIHRYIKHEHTKNIDVDMSRDGKYDFDTYKFQRSHNVPTQVKSYCEEPSVVLGSSRPSQRGISMSPDTSSKIGASNILDMETIMGQNGSEQGASTELVAAMGGKNIIDNSSTLVCLPPKNRYHVADKASPVSRENHFKHNCMLSLKDGDTPENINTGDDIDFDVNIKSCQRINNQKSIIKSNDATNVCLVDRHPSENRNYKQKATGYYPVDLHEAVSNPVISNEHVDALAAMDKKNEPEEIEIKLENEADKDDQNTFSRKEETHADSAHKVEIDGNVVKEFYEIDDYVRYLSDRRDILRRLIQEKNLIGT